MLDRLTAPARTAASAVTPPAHRRILFALLVAGTMAGLLGLAAMVVPPRSAGAIVFLMLFAVPLPWSVVGFWNATIGLLLMLFSRDPVAAVNPSAARIRGDEPVVASTAILVCIRNESPEKVIRNLDPMLEGLARARVSHLFQVYMLSDTSDPEIAATEEACFGSFSAKWRDTIPVTYRRRPVNTGFKAGNIRDFCDRWGDSHEFALVLDADSFMPAEAVLRLLRVMQVNPILGILQTLIVGLPSASAFARMFQFGMRLGMRSYALGGAWWQGDCGPYWGHNAILRLKPFMAHCRLPVLPQSGPLGGHILSHDQVEAALMRRAGYEVRVLPEEGMSWEDNPPTLLEFIRRDLRWCQGNMQYWQLLSLPGLQPVSRFQFVFAILMYLGSPAWMALIAMGAVAIALSETPSAPLVPVELGLGVALFALMMLMVFAPKIASIVDILLHRPARRSHGGAALFGLNVASETVFSFLLSPVMAFIHTAFLFRLFLLRRGVVWNSQARESHAVPWRLAWKTLWPPTVAGFTVLGVVAAKAPNNIGFAFIAVGGLVFSVPFAVATASPLVGTLLMRIGLGRIPEEIEPPAVLLPLHLPAIEAGAPAAQTQPSAHHARWP
jgi:membrane glycosyltransferase